MPYVDSSLFFIKKQNDVKCQCHLLRYRKSYIRISKISNFRFIDKFYKSIEGKISKSFIKSSVVNNINDMIDLLLLFFLLLKEKKCYFVSVNTSIFTPKYIMLFNLRSSYKISVRNKVSVFTR